MPSRTDPTEWMWARACDMIEEAERLHRRFFHLAVSSRAQAAWEPPVDVFEDDREIVIVVAMPGVPLDQVRVAYEPGVLAIRGTRALPVTGSRHVVRHLEIPYGAFERRIALPDAHFEVGAPEVALGCLMLRLHKTEPR
ncbi:MAG TPA: Hsp20/alpha crystallin family protein [Casimicrobiaceae bacterium]|nr:Hsp20/alpha crystallin family protein [Casimicrobiaceae bacterium]